MTTAKEYFTDQEFNDIKNNPIFKLAEWAKDGQAHPFTSITGPLSSATGSLVRVSCATDVPFTFDDLTKRKSSDSAQQRVFNCQGYQLSAKCSFTYDAEKRLMDVQPEGQPDPETSKAIFLPWRDNSVHWMKLPLNTNARLFITPMLQMCAFFVTGDPKQPTVAHAHICCSQRSQRSQLYADMKEFLHQAFPSDCRNIKITHVGEDGKFLMVFGLCDQSGDWTFYHQKQQDAGDSSPLASVLQLWP